MKTIYGECTSGGSHAPVTIARLARDECELLIDAPHWAFGSDLALWIGAIGPLAITAQPHGGAHARHLVARFVQPLEPAIIAHFAA